MSTYQFIDREVEVIQSHYYLMPPKVEARFINSEGMILRYLTEDECQQLCEKYQATLEELETRGAA